MPLDEVHGLGTETKDGSVCQHCLGEDGCVRPCEEIFEGGVQFFESLECVKDRELAERLTRKNMKSLSYWQNHPHNCLDGVESSQEEFMKVISSL